MASWSVIHGHPALVAAVKDSTGCRACDRRLHEPRRGGHVGPARGRRRRRSAGGRSCMARRPPDPPHERVLARATRRAEITLLHEEDRLMLAVDTIYRWSREVDLHRATPSGS